MNKLGINSDRLERYEKELVSTKLDMLDETFTFNEESFNADYLLKLNEFLLGDIYTDLGYRDDTYRNIIDISLKRINELAKESNKEEILQLLENVWSYQPFKDGNTRTLIGFLKIIDNAYNLDLDIDVNKDIESIFSYTKGAK